MSLFLLLGRSKLHSHIDSLDLTQSNVLMLDLSAKLKDAHDIRIKSNVYVMVSEFFLVVIDPIHNLGIKNKTHDI